MGPPKGSGGPAAVHLSGSPQKGLIIENSMKVARIRDLGDLCRRDHSPSKQMTRWLRASLRSVAQQNTGPHIDLPASGQIIRYMLELQDKIALVTGGSRGIGAAVCLALARAGVHVAVNYRARRDGQRGFVQKLKRSLKKYGVTPTTKETGGYHAWTNWRDYLHEFAAEIFH